MASSPREVGEGSASTPCLAEIQAAQRRPLFGQQRGMPMSGLSISNVTKQFGDFRAVESVSLSVPQGTFVCLLGPSGCGKTTLLRMIAGLEEPSSGAIVIDGEDITSVPTHKRNFGMVFQ